MMTKSVWTGFDDLAAKLVSKEITFASFVRATGADFGRMARIAGRRRRLPAWLGEDDLKNELVALCWHYAFERVAKDGHVGFDPKRYVSAGAYLRWKIRMKVQKGISRARGENQHARSGAGAPEYLSKTGELPEVAEETMAETMLDRGRKLKRLEGLAQCTRDFVLLRALAQGLGDDRRVIGFVLDQSPATRQEIGIETAAEAYAAVHEFVDDWTKKHGAKPLPKGIAA